MIGRTPLSATCSTSLPVTRRTTVSLQPDPLRLLPERPIFAAADYNVACNAVVKAVGVPPFGPPAQRQRPSLHPRQFRRGGPLARPAPDRQCAGALYLLVRGRMCHAAARSPASPYYSELVPNLGTPYDLGKEGNAPETKMSTSAPLQCISSLLGSGYAGYVYGSEGIWQSAVEADFSERSCGDTFSSGARRNRPAPAKLCLLGDTDYRTLVPCTVRMTATATKPRWATRGLGLRRRRAGQRARYLLFVRGRRHRPRAAARRPPGEALATGSFWIGSRWGEWQAPGELLTVPDDTILDLRARPE